MASFPDSLPKPLAEPYRLDALDAVLRTDMEIGAPRARRRTKARLDRVRLSWILTDAQMIIWRAWWDSALHASAGASWVTMTLAFGDGGLRAREVRFTGPWSARPFGGLKWIVEVDAEARGGELTVDQQRGAIAGLVFDGVYPSLYLDFTDEALDARISFSRASTKRYVGADGKYYEAAANVWPREYDPYTLACVGRVVEGQRTNYLTYSDDFANASWTKTGVTITSDAVASPMSGVNADLIVENTNTSQHGVSQTVSNLADNTVHTHWACVKPAGRSVLYLAMVRKDGSTASAYFTCSGTGSVSNETNTLSTAIGLRADGYYRCEITCDVLSGATTPVARVRLAPVEGTLSYTGDGVSGMYVWQAQLENGPAATSPIITGASTVTRSTDVPLISGANFSSWFNRAEGTFLVDARSGTRYANATVEPVVLVANSGSGSNRIDMRYQFTATQQPRAAMQVAVGGATQASMNSGQTETTTRWVGVYKTDDFALIGRGTVVATDTSGSLPTVDRMHLGQLPAGGNNLNGPIARIVYWPVRLANTYCQALTQ